VLKKKEREKKEYDDDDDDNNNNNNNTLCSLVKICVLYISIVLQFSLGMLLVL
jgi:hypothetical protein